MSQRKAEGSLCDEIAADAAALMAMPPGAPERARAEEHARTHAPCARALDEGRHLLALIGASPLPAPSPAALARTSAAVFAEMDAAASARAGATKLAAAVAAAVLATWAIPLAVMRAPVVAGAPLAMSIGLALLAAVASAATVTWGGRFAAAFPALSALSAVAVAGGAQAAPMVGLHCAAIEGATAVAAGILTWLAARALARDGRPPALAAAAVGGGALAGHAALTIGCSAATELPHVMLFHTAPVAVAVALALLLATAPRQAPQT